MRAGTRETTYAGGKRPRERMSLAMLPVVILVAVVGAAWPGAAFAVPSVCFSPGSVMLTPGETVEMSFHVAPCDDLISGYQLYFSFDPELVELVSASEGSLYVLSGFTTWFISDEMEPGHWHFFDTVMGVGTYVVPPGELLHLEFQALDYGTAEIHIDSILLADEERENLPVGGYEHAFIYVLPQTGVEESSIASVGPPYPNPFVASTRVPFNLEASSRPRFAEVYDIAGRLVRRLPLAGGDREGEIVWDGRDEHGREVTSAVYYLRVPGFDRAACRLVKLR